jgi:WD40 repeat protein
MLNNNNSLIEDSTSIHRLVFNLKWGSYVGSLDQTLPPVCVWRENSKRNIVSLISLASNDVIGLSQYKCLLLDRAKETRFNSSNYTDTLFMALIEWGLNDDYIKIKTDGQDKPSLNLLPIRSNEHVVVVCCCIGVNYLVIGKKSGLISVYKLKKEKNSVQLDSFYCNLYGHKQEITDIFVCGSYSTMATASQDGLLIIWDINKLSFVNSIQINPQSVYKIAISETTNDIAFIANSPNKLYFYTGNCELIKEINCNLIDSNESSENVTMKSLCFSNQTEGMIN